MLLRLGTALCVVFMGSQALAAGPRVVWSVETRGKIYAPPVLADLDGDGTLEVIIAASRDRRLICLDHAGNLRWDLGIEDGSHDGLQAAPSAADYDGDGRKEVFYLSKGGTTGCVDADGRVIWTRDMGDKMDYTGPVLADVNNDGRIEILFGSESGTLYCLDDAGESLWHYQGEGPIRGIPAVASDPRSGTLRVYVTFSGGREACLDSTGGVIWAFDEPKPRKERRCGPAVGDLDGDGTPEVVSATDDFHIIVRNALTGEEEWRWKGAGNIDQTCSFALADFDRSGKLDIVCGDGAGQGGPGHVYRLRDGKPVWAADVGGSVVQGPCVGDVDGDGNLDILVCSRSKRLVCLTEDGREAWSIPSVTEVITTPAVGDLDGNGTVEILMTSKDKSVYCLTLDGKAAPGLLPWPMINHDAQLSGNIQGAPFKGTPATAPAGPTDALTLGHFGPLRLGANDVSFSYANTASRPRRLAARAEVVRPDGTLITHLVRKETPAYRRESVRFDLRADAGGPYHLRMDLADVGTGMTVATLERDMNLEPLMEERRELEALQSRADVLTPGLPSGPLQERARAALKASVDAVAASLADAQAVLARSGVTARERDDAVERVHAALKGLQHDAARLRAAALTPKAEDFAVVPDTTLRKVFKDEPYLPEDVASRQAAISLAANEAEGVQVVVVPLWKDLENLRVSAGTLTSADGSRTIPAESLAVNRIGYVEIGPSEYNWYVEKQGYYPDILYPGTATSVPAGQDAQPFFVTVQTSAGTVPGDYAGAIRVEADGCPAVEIPLKVHVWDFALSDQTHLKTSMWMNAGQIASFYKLKDGLPLDLREKWYDYHLQHRVGPVKDFPVGGGDMVADFEYLIPHGMNCFFIPLPASLPDDRRPAFAEKLRSTRALLQQKGWDSLALFYTRDELAVMGRHEIPRVVEFSQWVKTAVPEWPRLQTSAPEQAILGVADVWCPTIDNFDPVMLKERMDQGDRLWFYTVWGRPGIMIEFPATDHRLMFWECWKYGAEGFLYWGTTHWGLNMKTDQRWPEVPWIPWNEQPGHNGCGYLLYPGPDATPMGSIRFELVRDGIEDYEYFYLLRDLLQRAGDKVPEDLRKHVEAILAVDPAVVVDNKTFTDDPSAILDARAEVARLIETLKKVN